METIVKFNEALPGNETLPGGEHLGTTLGGEIESRVRKLNGAVWSCIVSNYY